MRETPETPWDFDHGVIGLGLVGSGRALRLSKKGYSVGVMEMGRRWRPEDFPKSNWDARRYFWRPGLRMFRLPQHAAVPPRGGGVRQRGGERLNR